MFSRDELNKLYQYAFSLSAQKSSAEDLLQTALGKMIKQPVNIPSLAYVRKIIRHQFIDDCRRNKIVSFETIDESSPVLLDTVSLEKQLIDEELITIVFSSMNAADREVLYLWAVMGYSASEIAKELKQPRGSVLSRLYRARQKILDNKLDKNLLGGMGEL